MTSTTRASARLARTSRGASEGLGEISDWLYNASVGKFKLGRLNLWTRSALEEYGDMRQRLGAMHGPPPSREMSATSGAVVKLHAVSTGEG